jgi:hypothetical protein
MNFRKLTNNEVFVTQKDLEMLSVMSAEYKYISVGMDCDFIASAKKWPFLPNNVIFGEPHDGTNWLTDSSRVKDLLSTLNPPVVGYHGHDYMQIDLDIFTPCIYKYIDGEWHYYLHPSVIEKTSAEYGI